MDVRSGDNEEWLRFRGLSYAHDITDYGATGGDEDADTAALLAAVADAQESGGMVVVPPNIDRFLVAEPIIITKPIIFTGGGRSQGETPTTIGGIGPSSVLQYIGMTGPLIRVDATVLSNLLVGLEISRLTLIGNRDVAGASAGSLIELSGGVGGGVNINGAVLEKLSLHSAYEHGIWLNGLVFNNVFRDIWIRRCLGDGVNLGNIAESKNAAQNRFYAVNPTTNGGHGFHQHTGGWNLIEAGQIVNNVGCGVYASKGWVEVVNNKFERNGGGAQTNNAVYFGASCAGACRLSGGIIGVEEDIDPETGEPAPNTDHAVRIASPEAVVESVKFVTVKEALLSDILVEATADRAYLARTNHRTNGSRVRVYNHCTSTIDDTLPQFGTGFPSGLGDIGVPPSGPRHVRTDLNKSYYRSNYRWRGSADDAEAEQYLFLRDLAAADDPGNLSTVLGTAGTLNDIRGATLSRQLTLAKGTNATQVFLTGSTLAQTARQDGFWGLFVSGPLLDAVTIDALSWEFGFTGREDNLNANMYFSVAAHLWRSGTGIIHTLYDAGAQLGNELQVLASGTRGRVASFAVAGGSAAAGDQLVIGAWLTGSQANAVARTVASSFGDTGTLPTEGSVNLGAAYIKAAQWLPLAA